MSSPLDPNNFSNLKQALGSICKQKAIEEVDKIKEAVEKDDPQKVIMAIPMLLALTICPAMLGTQEAIRSSQSKSRREEHRARRCNLVVSCVKPSIRSRDINNKLVVLKDSKLYIANELSFDEEDEPEEADSIRNGYPFSGYFLPYPDSEYEGLVTTISDDPPILNWIYVDRETYEVRYGVRADAQPNLTGPFDCTKQDRRMTLEGWEGFVAVEEIPGVWALYYDQDDDGLKNKIPLGTRVLEVELTRREKKERKPEPDAAEPMTLDEKMKQHKEQTRREEEEREKFVSQANGESDFMQQARREAEARGIDIDNLDESQAATLKEALQRLNLAGVPLAGALQSSVGSRSVATSDSAPWSDTEKHDDADSSHSVTVASSVIGHEATASHGESVPDGSVYQKPYVEDDS